MSLTTEGPSSVKARFSPLHIAWISSGPHPASCPVGGTNCSFLGR
jgi:hypothetical protein